MNCALESKGRLEVIADLGGTVVYSVLQQNQIVELLPQANVKLETLVSVAPQQ